MTLHLTQKLNYNHPVSVIVC